ncbi:hypothetical protein ACLE20_15115 [Rhizobium sp. YIM 134829]|uniref:hypothetical protein n=1 Tax=Rhizobium sp. YIM 134829 TaxID=3390453 RepID=UPI00397E5CF1
MPEQDLEDWLDEQMGDILHTPGFCEDPSQFATHAKQLEDAAIAEGYQKQDLIDFCNGDIARYLCGKQDEYTRDHIGRQE